MITINGIKEEGASASALASITQLFGTKVVAEMKWQAFTATAGQTTFPITAGALAAGSKSALLWIGGDIQQPLVNYTIPADDTVETSEGITVGTDVLIAWLETVESTGAEILFEEGVPLDANGSNGDLYVNTTNWDVYQKAAGTWGSAIGNIKGAAGTDGTDGDDGAQGASYTAANWVNVTGSRDIALTDTTKHLKAIAAATLTVRLNSAVAHDDGAEMVIHRDTAGVVAFAAEAGVTIKSKDNHLKISGQNGVACLKRDNDDPNIWHLFGSLEA